MQQGNPILLSTAFCAPIYYFRSISNAGKVIIEKHENFVKQTYRNRCVILGANGPLNLTIPVENGRSQGLKIAQVRIANHLPWQRNHWRSIVSAYKNSPYFDFFADDLEPFFSRKYNILFDYNLEITHTILALLNIDIEIDFTSAFEQVPPSTLNLREKISPKTDLQNAYPNYTPAPYTQVFENKFPFIPNLSILDLLFCEGTAAKEILTANS